ncbi:hypothetical protein LSCM1_06917 [Leishmania martiniquensis]|uniref:non-specific serine/threonine protein kinase n=1 Tax=Leishmania martiniquensis TaxID=1580590 RepID=A0A836HK99_9TRYP|nr:hypothetical protein LSCM1_06917 [Leishmania martiniquensis]
MNFLGGSLRSGGGHRKDRGFSSKNKVQQYHGDGSESIIVMGRPFRVLQKISDMPPPYTMGRQRSLKYGEVGSSYMYLVENSSHLPEFPRHLALKRSFFGVDQVAEAHKEVEIVSRIKDKNIVRVFHSEISRNEGRLGVSIAMEYCSNNLYRRIRNSVGGGGGTRLTEGEICHVMFAVTSAIGYLHAQQPPITHRDIRPENILINNRNTGPAAYKLTSFSSATTEAYHCENREEANMAIADIQLHTNPAFRAPEMCDPWRKKRICEKVDMWAMGVLLYYMMYLRLPFDPNCALGQQNWAFRIPPQSVGAYTGSLQVMIEHLLDPDPDSRWDVFALINFMRFDGDCSRHLGTFCFTKTEWPEGWEEQDVKVLGRAAPAKAPPVSYKEPGHEQVDKRGTGSRGGGRNSNHHGLNSYDAPASSTALNHMGSSGAATGTDAVQEAMIVLGGDPADDDPEMAMYRRQIIKEQEAAWERAKAAAGRQDSPPTEPLRSGAEPAPTTAGNEAEKKDVFDDLFAGPSPVASPSSLASPPPSGNGLSAPPMSPQQSKDIFSAGDLFSAPPPQAQPSYPVMMDPYAQAPQQQPAMAMGVWGSGAPVMGSGGYPVQPPQQQQGPWGYGGGSTNMYAPPPQPQQSLPSGYPMQQQAMNFMAPAPGQQPAYDIPNAETKPASPAPAASKKDPFADLFK